MGKKAIVNGRVVDGPGHLLRSDSQKGVLEDLGAIHPGTATFMLDYEASGSDIFYSRLAGPQ